METRSRPPHTSLNTHSTVEHTPGGSPRFLTPAILTAAVHGTGERKEPGHPLGDPRAAPQPLPEHRDIPPVPVAGHRHSPSPPLATVTSTQELPVERIWITWADRRDKTRVSQHRRVNPPQQNTLAPLEKSRGNQSTPSAPSHCMLSVLLCFP